MDIELIQFVRKETGGNETCSKIVNPMDLITFIGDLNFEAT